MHNTNARPWLAWIKRQQALFQGQDRQSAREYVSRESHYYWGDRYLLNVAFHDAPPQVVVRNKIFLDLFVRGGSDAPQRERVLQEWYRRQLKAAIPPLIARWEPVIGVQVADWGVKRMKTRWGACTVEAGRIWLNLELVKKHGPPKTVEGRADFPFIVVSPQCPAGELWDPDTLLALLDEVAGKYAVDESRVYLTGLSMGGYGTWALASVACPQSATSILGVNHRMSNPSLFRTRKAVSERLFSEAID